ncbi:hypothetical protein BDEG_26669 [Batrachochytrium dendrobatidis JEL423]|uniref:Uncharacterized protein n=1 Tax=Batrachochytrium dendrobatidis (strain JEL423) TaxID=403673 RepID=A0A177WV57_BATDL|nr:hypothetical protein BDEG_26669 [Batrachochytrium dendrobatidis JEL423]
MLLRSIPPPSWSDGIPTAAPPFPFKVADPSTLLSLLVFLTPPVSKYYLENPSKCYIDSSSNYVVDSKKHDGIHILPDATLAALPRSYILWEASSSHGVQLCIVGHPSLSLSISFLPRSRNCYKVRLAERTAVILLHTVQLYSFGIDTLH